MKALPEKVSRKTSKKIRNSSSLPALKYKLKKPEKEKLNILACDQLESKMMTLMDQNSVDSEVELASQYSTHSLVARPEARKVALQHIRQKKENIENSQDFVTNSRKILMKGISIQDKHEETRRLEGKSPNNNITRIHPYGEREIG